MRGKAQATFGDVKQKLKVTKKTATKEKAAQPLGPLAAALLEPESDDGLTAWNAFDRYLAAPWGSRPLAHPVARVLGDAPFVTETVRPRD